VELWQSLSFQLGESLLVKRVVILVLESLPLLLGTFVLLDKSLVFRSDWACLVFSPDHVFRRPLSVDYNPGVPNMVSWFDPDVAFPS